MTIENEKKLIDKVDEIVNNINMLKKIIREQDEIIKNLQHEVYILKGC